MGEVQRKQVVPFIRERAWEGATPPNLWFIEIQKLEKAEKAASQILSKLQPTVVAEKKRIEVIIYLQRLLKSNLDCELFAYGSVPLRTYLPDGDIDLTAVSASKTDLAEEIAKLLENEAKNSSSEFVVKDVQLVRAEVKLVKCLVQNIVVDISSNQIGGLSTLCFLEQVDREIGKDHLFKQSIILIKAWCYYESRTLGAHAGLISTYGLETLVLYIFHVFHRVLNGPFSVLYTFLEYFSTFDWDTYCISLIGPVKVSALPKIVPADHTPNSHDLLLRGDFLRHCSETFSVPMRRGDKFSKKHLNIIDPLKDNNNLGRSVSRGNLVRIRSAFSYGFRKLRRIINAPADNIADELRDFFSNTLNTHGSGNRPDLQDPISSSRLDCSTVRLQGLKISEDSHKVSSSSSEGKAGHPVIMPYHAPHLYFQNSNSVDKKMENGGTEDENQLMIPETEVVSSPLSEPLDLTGDLYAHLACLQQVRWCHGYVPVMPVMLAPAPPVPPPLLVSMSAMDHAHHMAHVKGRNGFHGRDMNGFGPHPGFQPPNKMLMPRPPFGPEPNHRGTKTYSADMNRPPHGYQDSPANGTSNGMVIPSPRGELPHSQFSIDQGRGTQTFRGADVSHTPRRRLNQKANSVAPSLEGVRPPMPMREPLQRRSRQRSPNQAIPAEETQRPEPVSGMDGSKVQSPYRLKDDDDFPPLV